MREQHFGLPEKLRPRNIQSAGYAQEQRHGGLPLSTFQLAVIRAIYARVEGERILRELPLLSDMPNHRPDRARDVRLERCRALGRRCGMGSRLWHGRGGCPCRALQATAYMPFIATLASSDAASSRPPGDYSFGLPFQGACVGGPPLCERLCVALATSAALGPVKDRASTMPRRRCAFWATTPTSLLFCGGRASRWRNIT